jgi:predicted HTH domain antitoxin
MQITLNLPEDIARHLETGGAGIPRAALEGLALEGYRSGKLTESQVRRLLEFGTRYEVHGFLKEHGVPLRYSERDLDRDLENARKFSEKWSSSRTPRQ